MRRLNYFLAAILLLAVACKKADTGELLDSELSEALRTASNGVGEDFYRFPTGTAGIPQDPLNPITDEKIELGRFLYHETGLATNPKKSSGALTYSCSSCHHVQGGFQAAVPQGIGEGGSGFGAHGEGRVPNPNYDVSELDVQPLRTPSALNIAYQTNILWNGQFGATGVNTGTQALWTPGTPIETNNLGYEGTETQAIAGLDVHRMVIDSAFLGGNPIYKGLFDLAFIGEPEDERITQENAGLAIAAFERTLLATEAPFQRWLNGDRNAMSEKQKRGAVLFFGKAGCYNCHNGPALNEMEFYALGFNDLLGAGTYGVDPAADAHKGRGSFTKNTADDYKFKVPQLYNLKDSPFYGHGATFTKVEELVRYKNAAVPQNANVPAGQLAAQFVPLNLSDEEISDITEFLENALHDDNLERYVPVNLPSGNCFPNMDAMSAIDLGCN